MASEQPGPGRVLRAQPTVDPSSLAEWRDKGKARVLPAESLQDGSWLLKAGRENAATCAAMTRGRFWKPLCALTWGSCCSGSEGMRFVAEALNVLHAESLADGQKFENVLTHKFSCECNAEKQKWIMAVDRFAESTLKQVAKAEAKAKAGSAQDGTGPGAVNLEPSATGEGDRGDEVGSNKSSSSGTSAEKAKSSSAEAGSDSAPMSPMSVSSAEGALSEQEPVCLFRDIQDMGKPVADCVVHNQPCPVPTVDLLVIGTSCKDMSKANPSAPKGLVLKEQSSRGG